MKKYFPHFRITVLIWSIILISLIHFLPACNKEKNNQQTISGLYLPDFGRCYNSGYGSGVVIKDSSEYAALRDSLVSKAVPLCADTAKLPLVDFNKNTLIGIYKTIQCSFTNLSRTIQRDTIAREYIYTLRLSKKENCKLLIATMNWVLIPKLTEGYTVKFIVNEDE